MFEKYIDWNAAVIQMLRSHKDNQIALESLREQLSEIAQSMTSIGAMDYAKLRVSGGDNDPSDGIVNQILHKQEIKRKIARMEAEDKLYMQAWNALTEDEQCILREFFQTGRRPSQDAVDVLCDAYGWEYATVYRKRKQTLRKFKRLLIG